MRETAGIEEFREQMTRMDDPTLSLLDALFRARGQAWQKLHALCQQARPAEGEPAPAWSRWEFDIPGRQHASFARRVGTLIRAEGERRYEAALAAERARRDSITIGDAESLDDAELLLARAVLVAPLDTADSRWLLLGRLGACWPRGLRSSTWRKFARVAGGPEAIRAAATASIESEARRRGLIGEGSGSAAGPDGEQLHPGGARQADPRPARSGSRPRSRGATEAATHRR